MILSAYPSSTLLSMGFILWQLIFIMIISYHRFMRIIVPDLALNLDQNMRVRRLLFSGPSMDFPMQERTSGAFFTIL